jgi:hypothetical protein
MRILKNKSELINPHILGNKSQPIEHHGFSQTYQCTGPEKSSKL